MRTLGVARTAWPFAGLQLASIVVNLGNAIATVVYPWLVYDLTGSAGWMGVVAFVTLLPVIVGTAFGGVLAERVGIRRIALSSVILGALASIAAAAAYDAGMLTIGLLVALALMGALLDGPGGVAIEARVPEIARMARMPLMRANAIDDLIDNAAAIAGPAVAAVLVAVTTTTVLLWIIAAINAAAAVLVAASLPRFRLRQTGKATLRELRVGLRFVLGSAQLRAALLLAGFGTGIFVALQAIVLPAILRIDGRSAALLGLFLAAASAGAILVNLGLALVGRTPSLRGIFIVAFVGLAAGVLLLAVNRSVVALMASGAILGVAAGPLSPVFATLLQSGAPKEMRANVIGISMSLLLVSAPLASLAAGAALDGFGATPVLVAGAAMLFACAVFSAVLPGLRDPNPPARRTPCASPPPSAATVSITADGGGTSRCLSEG